MAWSYSERPRRRPLDTPVRPAGSGGGGGAPSGPAGGDLTGSYPNPDIAAGVVGTPELVNGAVTDAKVTDVAWSKITGAPAPVPGPPGPTGPTGPAGATGPPGETIIDGLGPPAVGIGADGDYYLDQTNHTLYGPKSSTALDAARFTNVDTDVFSNTMTGVYRLGMEYRFLVSGQITGARWKRTADADANPKQLYLFNQAGTLVATSVYTSETAGVAGWIRASFPTPVPINPNDHFTVAFDHPATGTTGYTAPPGPTMLDATKAAYVQARYVAGVGGTTFPNNVQPDVNRFVDIEFRPAGGNIWPVALVGVTSGGAAGTVLTKTGATDYATAWTPPATSLPPTGAAGGDLTGTYPNPELRALAVGTPELADGAVTDAKVTSVAYSKVTGAPTALPPSGTAGGSLAGTYPNPTLTATGVGAGTYGTATKVARVTLTAEGRVASVTEVDITAGGAPSGPAGGDLAGTYPNPTVAKPAFVNSTAPPSSTAGRLWWDSNKKTLFVHDGLSGFVYASPVPAELWDCITFTNSPPPGAGELRLNNAGTQTAVTALYLSTTTGIGQDVRNFLPRLMVGQRLLIQDFADATKYQVYEITATPSVQTGYVQLTVVWREGGAALVTARVVVRILDPTATGGPPTGPAGGDLTGTYPNPTIAAGAVGNAEISDVAYAKVTGAPTSLPPSGAAGGSLAGTYPNPTLAASGVTAATYGDQYNVAKVTVNAEGRVTAVVQVLIRARWG